MTNNATSFTRSCKLFCNQESMDGTEELEVMNGDDDDDGDYYGRMKNYDDMVVLCALKK